jgi:hypothetical protein
VCGVYEQRLCPRLRRVDFVGKVGATLNLARIMKGEVTNVAWAQLSSYSYTTRPLYALDFTTSCRCFSAFSSSFISAFPRPTVVKQ